MRSNRARPGRLAVFGAVAVAGSCAALAAALAAPWWASAIAVAGPLCLVLAFLPLAQPGAGQDEQPAGESTGMPGAAKWGSQIEEARQQGDRAIMGLVDAFTALSGKLQTVAQDAEKTSGDVFDANAEALRAAKQDLRPLIESLRQSVVARKKAIREVAQLHAITKELAGMADQVRLVARQTDLLAVNAAIQASRAGEAGRGFNVVAAEIRRLAAFSAETGRDISDRIRRVKSTMKALDEYATQADVDDEKLVTSSEHLITEILTPLQNLVADLLASAAGMLSTNASVRDEIEQMTAHLQFQDRVSQILERLRREMARAEAGEPPVEAPVINHVQSVGMAEAPRPSRAQAEPVEFF
jgi:hypothetical protein